MPENSVIFNGNYEGILSKIWDTTLCAGIIVGDKTGGIKPRIKCLLFVSSVALEHGAPSRYINEIMYDIVI